MSKAANEHTVTAAPRINSAVGHQAVSVLNRNPAVIAPKLPPAPTMPARRKMASAAITVAMTQTTV